MIIEGEKFVVVAATEGIHRSSSKLRKALETDIHL